MKCWDEYERVPGTKGSCRKRIAASQKSNTKTRVSPKRRSKPRKVSPKKRSKVRKVSPKRTKSRKVSPKRTKSRRISPKKKTSIRESLTYSIQNDGVSINNLPDISNSEAARKLEILETLLLSDEKCSKYIKNPFLTLPYQEKQNMLASLLQKSFSGNISDEEEKNLEYLENAVKSDPVKVQEEKEYREQWILKYMSPGKAEDNEKYLPSQAEFWYNTIIKYVPPSDFASYNTSNKRVIKMFENIYRATNINNNFTSENAKNLAFELYSYQKQSYDAMNKLAVLKDELKEQQDKLKIIPATEVNKIIDSKNALIDEQNTLLSALNSEIIKIKNQIEQLENFNNSAYWETPMSVLLTNDEKTKTKLTQAQNTDPLILSDFDLPDLTCPLKKVQTMNKNMLFDYEPYSECLIERDAYKLKMFATNISTKPLLAFKSIAPVTENKPNEPGYKLQGEDFYQTKAYNTLAGFIKPKKFNISTKMPESGLAKCEMLAMYYFLDKIVEKPKDANIPSVLEMIIKNVPITDDDIRDPQDSIDQMLSSEDSIDSFFRTLYLTMSVPEYNNTDTKNIYKALEISDEQFSEFLTRQKRESAVSKLVDLTKQASEALEQSQMLKQAGNLEEAIEKLSIKTALSTAINNVKKYTTGLEYSNAVEVLEKITRAEKSYEILVSKPKKGVLKSPSKRSPARPGRKGANIDLLAGLQGGKKNLRNNPFLQELSSKISTR